VKKVKRERARTEFKKMFEAPSALHALENLYKYGVLSYLIAIPEKGCSSLFGNAKAFQTCIDRAMANARFFTKHIVTQFGFHFTKSLFHKFTDPQTKIIDIKEIRYLLYISCLMDAFSEFNVEIKAGKFEPLVPILLKESLKCGKEDIEIISMACKIKNHFRTMAEEFIKTGNIRAYFAKVTKDMGLWSNTWEISFILALLDEIYANPNHTEKIASAFEKFYNFIYKHHLQNIYDWKPLLDVITRFVNNF
jgi:tRNA nucleotidyltransferase/poly(A) polymerase